MFFGPPQPPTTRVLKRRYSRSRSPLDSRGPRRNEAASHARLFAPALLLQHTKEGSAAKVAPLASRARWQPTLVPTHVTAEPIAPGSTDVVGLPLEAWFASHNDDAQPLAPLISLTARRPQPPCES